MESKKKNLGIKMSVLLLLLLLNLLALSTCSLASQPTLEEMTNFIDLIKLKQNNGELFGSNKITGNSTSIATQFLNLTTDIDYTLENVIYLTGIIFKSNGSWVTNSNITGVFVIANNSFSNNLPFLYIEYKRESTPNLYTTNSTGSDWGTFYTIVGSNVSKYENCTFLHYRDGNYEWSPNTELTVLTNNVIFTKLKTASIYVKYSGQFYPMLNNYGGQNYNEYYGITEEPEQPEEPENPDNPDVPGTGGSTGNITNPSGDTTGKVDLSGIEQGIGDINQNLNGISGEIGKLNNSVNDLNNFLSGDIKTETGEIEGALTIDTSEIEDPSEDFFTWVFEQIENVFTSTEEQEFSFKLYTENEYTVSSSQIFVPDGTVKTLIGLAGAFAIYYWMIRDVRKTINKIKEGSIESLATEDITANML